MDDLFEKLKSDSPVNKNVKVNEEFYKKLEKTRDFSKNDGAHSPRRDSVPAMSRTNCIPLDAKCRSASPLRSGTEAGKLRQVRVVLARKKFENYRKDTVPAYGKLSATKRKPNVDSHSVTKMSKMSNPSVATTSDSSTDEDLTDISTTVNASLEKIHSPNNKEFHPVAEKTSSEKVVILKTTPTKAQKKLFTSPLGDATTSVTSKHPNTKRCVVRMKKMNLEQLKSEFDQSFVKNHKVKTKSPKSSLKGKSKVDNSDSQSKRPRGRPRKEKDEDSFFIKLSTPKKVRDVKEKKSSKIAKGARAAGTTSTPIGTSPMTPTKFTRTHLINNFGYRFFQWHVQIKKINHPVMLAFEATERARMASAKAKRDSKRRNLTVSFNNQVEILGSCSESSDEEASGSFGSNEEDSTLNCDKSISAFTAPVTPTSLKKVENGKLVDDPELERSLFSNSTDLVVDDAVIVSSTPAQMSSPRAKRMRKSFSPLKIDTATSPLKERLKLANERVPPAVFGRLNFEDPEDDDEEYIVPTTIPDRHSTKMFSPSSLADTNPATFLEKSIDADVTEILDNSQEETPLANKNYKDKTNEHLEKNMEIEENNEKEKKLEKVTSDDEDGIEDFEKIQNSSNDQTSQEVLQGINKSNKEEQVQKEGSYITKQEDEDGTNNKDDELDKETEIIEGNEQNELRTQFKENGLLTSVDISDSDDGTVKQINNKNKLGENNMESDADGPDSQRADYSCKSDEETENNESSTPPKAVSATDIDGVNVEAAFSI